MKDRELRYTYANPSMLDLLERDLSDLAGITDEDLFDKVAAKLLEGEDRRALEGQVIESEHTLNIQGRRVTFNSVKAPLFDTEGTCVGLCGIARDVSERRATEAGSPSHLPLHRSRALTAALKQAELAARSDSLILLLGESGSGKDFLARHIHGISHRAGGPFFSINCAALAPELAESELFGHEAGAFTGARGKKRGMMELAEGGTLLLNEIGELPLKLQAKLLTFLDTQSFTRVGGEKEIWVSARLLAATNRNLNEEVESGRFRADLFHRLNVFTIEVPPLRKRPEDLPALVEALLNRLSRKLGLTEAATMDSRCLDMLTEYHWPGNVRELRNVLERALILAQGSKIRRECIQLPLSGQPLDSDNEWSLQVKFPHRNENLPEITNRVKSALLSEALRRADGKKKKAAQLLGISADSFKHHAKSVGL
jgi:transcriptional regulator with PAS, ATPase and Fis domain